MAKPSLDDYVDVAERISRFIERYPDGSLQTLEWSVEDVGGQLFIVYRALAYRQPDDERPGMGVAWEPFPGPTPYTRNSELMNAETSAWGRAIIAVGIGSKKIASKQEVRARQAEADQAPEPEFASQSDVEEMLAAAKGLAGSQVAAALADVGLPNVKAYNKIPHDKVVELIVAFGKRQSEQLLPLDPVAPDPG
jgi:hypothetical protein